MSEIKGLAAIKAYQEEQKRKAAERERPKAEWFSSVFPKELGDVTEVTFMQELDEEASGHNPDNGVGVIVVEHQAPGKEGFKRRALCTVDTEGQCYACERHSMRLEEDEGGWRQRQNLYINVAVEVKGTLKPYVLSRNANSVFTNMLIEEALEEGTLTDKKFRITKSGAGTTTQWTPKRLKEDAHDISGIKPWDLYETGAIRQVAYAEQADYYGAVYSGAKAASNSDAGQSGSTEPDGEW